VWIWGARDGNCDRTRISDSKNDAVIAVGRRHGRDAPIPADSDEIERFIMRWISGIQDQKRRDQVSTILRERLAADPKDTAALGEAWRRCEVQSLKISREEFDGRRVVVLRAAVCGAGSDGAAIASGVVRNWIKKEGREFFDKNDERPEFSAELAQALLGEDGKPCAPAKDYDEKTKGLLHDAAGPPPVAAASK
jgi:hypothetical protein